MTTRQTQTEAARIAIDAYREAIPQSSEDRGEVVTDLLADLRHLLQQEGIDPDQVFSNAEWHHQAEQDNRYEGWANHTTWSVNLWLNNEEATYRYWTEQATRHRAEAPRQSQVVSGIWSEADAACYYLADQLRDEVEEESLFLAEPSLYTDLFAAALSEVDWNEIAEAFLQSLDE